MSIDEAFDTIDDQWKAIRSKTANGNICNLSQSDLQQIRDDVDALFCHVEKARQQVNITLDGYKAHGASTQEPEESGSAESDGGCRRHDPCSEKREDVAKAKPSEDKAAAQVASEETSIKEQLDVLTDLCNYLLQGDKKCKDDNAQEEQQEKKARPRSKSGDAPQRKHAKSADRPPAPPSNIDKEEEPKASPPPAAESHGGKEEPQVSPPLPTPGGLATPRPGAGAGREGQVLIAALFDMISGGWLVGLSVSGGRGEWLGGSG